MNSICLKIRQKKEHQAVVSSCDTLLKVELFTCSDYEHIV